MSLLGARNYLTLLRRRFGIEFTGEEILGLGVLGRKNGEIYLALDQRMLDKEAVCDEMLIVAMVAGLDQHEDFAGNERPLVNPRIHVVLPHYCKGVKSSEYRLGKFDFIFETFQFDRTAEFLQESCPELLDFDITKVNDLHPAIKLFEGRDVSDDDRIAEFINHDEDYKIMVRRGAVAVPPFSHFKADSLPGYVVLLEQDGRTSQIGLAYEIGFALQRAWTAWRDLTDAAEETPRQQQQQQQQLALPAGCDSLAAPNGTCPECGGTDLIYGNLSAEKKREKVFCEVSCENCGKNWFLVYLPFTWQEAAVNF